jgi:hypothetical protein
MDDAGDFSVSCLPGDGNVYHMELHSCQYDSKGLSDMVPSLTAINTARRAGFGDDNFGQQGELWFELFPNPNGDIFARGVFQARNFVEEKVVKFFPDRFEDRFNVGVIHDPPELGIARAFDGDFHFKTMAVEAAALM